MDQLLKFSNDELVVEELLKSKVSDDTLRLKSVYNLYSINGFIQSNSNLTIHLPQFDALCSRILNFFVHKKLDLQQCLNKKN